MEVIDCIKVIKIFFLFRYSGNVLDAALSDFFQDIVAFQTITKYKAAILEMPFIDLC